MKSFYASVECADRGLNPFETGLVVADVTRGKNALCLAVSPKLKAQGVPGRCRLSEIPKNIEYEAVPPRMQRYIDCAADIYSIYLDYFDPRDIHVYSVDESFIDATQYLPACGMTPREFAKKLIDEIAERLHIPSTAGIGTNLYLAKIALDITAKHSKDHMGYLDEELYRETLWDHAPITDFWQIAGGTARRLARYGITTMREVAHADSELMYKVFGKDAELLIDHAWGRESCLISDIKGYKAKTHSVSFSQILPSDYDFDKARLVMQEMLLGGC
ncbi:MAG: DNA repair protein, partial [Oscillospiraceae bacterium]|nr:DNA repair protein [Oscillospiraceae bacterium]